MTVLTDEQAKAILPVLRAWEEWRLAGAPEGEPFSRDLGLCDAVLVHYNYGRSLGYEEADAALKVMFVSENRHRHYPFGEKEFFLTDVLYLDENRIAFVQRWIAYLEGN